MEIFWNIFESSSSCQRRSWPRICIYIYNFRPLVRVFCGGLSRERTIGNAQPDSVFIDVQQFYLAIDISNLAFLSSTCSVYFMRPQIRRPAALEVSRKGEKYESDGVKRLPSPKRIYELISSNRDFNKFNFRSRHSLSRFFYRDLLNPRQNNLCDATTSILQYREFYKDAYVCVCIYIYMPGLPFLRIDDYCQCIYPTGRLTHRSI